MVGERESVHDDQQARERRRSTLKLAQPRSMAALRPSQRRAAEHRAERERELAVELWLRRITRR